MASNLKINKQTGQPISKLSHAYNFVSTFFSTLKISLYYLLFAKCWLAQLP